MVTTTGASSADASVRRRQPPEVRRRMLLKAASSVIAERGLHATTIRDVAAAGGVAVGTVTYHFAGMAALLAEVVRAELQDYSAPFMSAAETAANGREALQHIVNGLLADGERARRHWKLWLDFWALSAHDAQYAAWQRDVYAGLHALVERSIRRGTDDGSIASVHDTATSALEFVALQDGLVVQCYLPDARLTPERARLILSGRFAGKQDQSSSGGGGRISSASSSSSFSVRTGGALFSARSSSSGDGRAP